MGERRGAVRGVLGIGGCGARVGWAGGPPARPSEPLGGAGQEAHPTSTTFVDGRQARSLGYSKRTRRASSRPWRSRPPARPGGPYPRNGRVSADHPALRTKLGYGEVRGCYYGKLGRTDHREVTSAEARRSSARSTTSTPRRIPFLMRTNYFSTVLCCELLEHLFEDPMHLMSEINRILKPGGHLVLTTPNMASMRAIAAILQGYHPGFFHAYIRPAEVGRSRRAPQPRVHSARNPPVAGERGLRSDAARNRRVPRRAAARIRLGPPPAGALPATDGSARRRHLRGRAARPARSRSDIPAGFTHERGVPQPGRRSRDRLPSSRCAMNRAKRGGRRTDSRSGYHLFDADTGTLIVDGPRVHLERDVAPGETVPVLSNSKAAGERPVPGVDLAHAGGRLLVLRARVAVSAGGDGDAGRRLAVERVRVTTSATLRRERRSRSLGRAFVLPVRTIWRNRGLIRSMVRRDILGRYRGSFGGAFWTVINPLLLMLTYFFVFGVVLRRALRRRSQPDRVRAVFPRRDAAVAGVQRGRGPRAGHHAGASQFRQETGVRGGDAAGEPGGGGTGDGAVRDGALLRVLLAARGRDSGHRGVAAAAADSADRCSRRASRGFWRHSACSCATWARSWGSC